METLEQAIGYTFQNKELLQTALTHASYANESKKQIPNNERLEFLGDSVLSIVVADFLFHSQKKLPEGELTRRRAALVCEPALRIFAKRINLGSYLYLGRGENMSGGRERASILSDAFEALIAAIYLDGGLEAARDFILPFIQEGTQGDVDYKTKLQETIQQASDEKIRYHVTAESGPDHNKQFTVEVHLHNGYVGVGTGHSKKLAEQQAARHVLLQMEREKE